MGVGVRFGKRRLAIVAGSLVIALIAVAPPASAAKPKPKLKTVICGEGITESIRVANPLDCDPGEDGLVVMEDGITIDLNGHLIRGDGDPGDRGIDNTGGFDEVTIRNGSITGFNEGVRFEAATGGKILDLEVFGNTGHGVILALQSTDARVARNKLYGNGANGIGVFNQSERATVKRNDLSFNGDSGISVNDGDGTSIDRNVAVGNVSLHGIVVSMSEGISITGNRTTGNGADGINVSTSDDVRVIENHSSGNAQNGLDLGGEDLIVKLNRSIANVFNGIGFKTGSSGKVVENVASGNGNDGIFIASSPTTLVKSNRAHQNGRNGIGTNIGGDFIGNKANRNGFFDGVDEGGTANEMDEGIGLGIAGKPDTTGSGNRAKLNDDPDECLPVTLC